MANTKIEWADRSWNPVTGCTPVSDGCRNCYAARMAKRLRGRCGYPADEPFRVTLHPERLEEPLRWEKPARIFVCSMGDLFHEDVPDEFIYEVFDRIAAAEHHKLGHIFMVLTKRPQRMAEIFSCDNFKETICWWQDGNAVAELPWPLPNLWLGVTAENQEQADKRIPILLQIPAAVRFVSVEPMLGPINLSKYHKDFEYGWECEYDWLYNPDGEPTLDWVICGGETGPGARPMHPDWVRSLRDQVKAAGVQFFFKGWGEFQPYMQGCGNAWVGSKGPVDLDSETRLFKVGKKAAGRLLDGRTWDEYPEMRR